MKLIDRIIFGFIAVCLGILAVRSLTVKPVDAAKEQIIKVNLYEIGGQRVWRDWLINK